MDKWISIHRYMPPMHRQYCGVTSAYQSHLVKVKTLDGDEFNATLQLYGNNLDGWKSEWWNDGRLSDRTKIESVVCWREVGIQEIYGDAVQTFEEVIETHEYWIEMDKKKKK